jgi:tetratricopeptide (TPR) repeat protein
VLTVNVARCVDTALIWRCPSPEPRRNPGETTAVRNCDQHQDATAAYELLLTRSPDWAEGHRHLSGSRAAAGDLDGAIPHALRAVELMPDDNGTAIHAAELLLRAGNVVEAAGLVRAAAERAPDDDRVVRVLSAIEMVLDRLDAALVAIDAALAIAPDNPDYHLHRGHLLYRLGNVEAAAAAFATAAALDPSNAAAKRAQMTLHLDHGQMTEATALGGALLHSHPEDKGRRGGGAASLEPAPGDDRR